MLDLQQETAETASTNAYVTLVDWNLEGHVLANIQVHNSGLVNGLHTKILGSVDGGANYDDELLAQTLIAASAAHAHYIVNRYYTNVRIQIKSAVEAAHTTAIARLAATRGR